MSCTNFFRHYRDTGHSDEVGSNNNLAEDGSEDVEMMDENIAALVLTSLSCSPQSPQYHTADFRGILHVWIIIAPLLTSLSCSPQFPQCHTADFRGIYYMYRLLLPSG